MTAACPARRSSTSRSVRQAPPGLERGCGPYPCDAVAGSRHGFRRRLREGRRRVVLGRGTLSNAHQRRGGWSASQRERYRRGHGHRTGPSPIAGLAEAKPQTNRTIFTLSRFPAKLAVIGGGPIGLELGQSFLRLSAEVTVFEAADRIAGTRTPKFHSNSHALERDGNGR